MRYARDIDLVAGNRASPSQAIDSHVYFKMPCSFYYFSLEPPYINLQKKKDNTDMSRSYAREKFGSAVEHMATSPQSLHDRLFEAYIIFSVVGRNDLDSDEERAVFDDIKSTLTREVPINDEGKVRATLNKMNDSEASSVASLISSLNLMLHSEA